MERNLLRLLLLLVVLLPLQSFAQVLIYSEGFETDGEGSRYTSNTFSLCTGTPGNNPDYFFSTNSNPVIPTGCSTGFGSTLTNLQGSFFWAGEDIRSSSPVPNAMPPGQLTTVSINVTSYNALTVSVFLATANNNNIRWESTDSINIQASLDGGPFRTVGRFMGDNVSGGHLRIDANLDGLITVSDPSTICDTILFTKHTFSIPGTGTNLQVRLDFDQIGGTEESAFDQIEVSGVFLGSPEINVVGNGNNILSGDTSPNTTDGTDFGNQNTCLGAVAHTFTIENTGLQPLNLSGLIFTGANPSDFAIITQPSSTVAAAGSTTFTAIFNPTANGFRIATLIINNNDPDEGNYSFSVQGIGLADTISPAITCPASSSANNDAGNCDAVVTYSNPVATDNCGTPTTTLLGGLPSGSSFPVGTTVNTFQAMDGDGNVQTCVFTVTITDIEAPNAQCQGDTVILDAGGNATIGPGDIDGGSTDNCSIDSISVSPSAFTSSDVGINIVTLTVIDGSGNSSTCQGFVLVLDTNITGVNTPLQGNLNMTISPNPTFGVARVEVECPACLPGDELYAQVTALDGKIVKRLPLVALAKTQNIVLDLSQVAKGSYILSLHHNGVVVRKQVLRY